MYALKQTSFSQNNMINACLKWWYYNYLVKLKTDSDMCYADAGNVVHKCLEISYTENKEISELKELFEFKWNDKKLGESKISSKKDAYWLMILNGIEKKVNMTSAEFKIFYPDVVGYLDGINTTDDIIIDWKTSTRTEHTDKEYTLQMKFYAYLYYRKFGRLPKKCVVYYLKTGKELEYIPTDDGIIEAEEWHFTTREKLKKAIKTNNFPKCIDENKECGFFCPYKEMCLNNTEGELNLTFEMYGNYIRIKGPITPLLHQGIMKKFSYELKNSYFIKKARPNYDAIVRFWSVNKQIIPIGFYTALMTTLNDYCIYKKLLLNINVEDKRRQYDKTIVMPDKFVNNKVLREYQLEAVNKFLREKIAIIEVATGGGKTEIAIEIIRRLGCKTLFIVDKVELLKQTKKRLEDSLGITIGMIGDSTEDIQDITVATVQSLMANLNKHKEYLSTITFCIMDEVHHIAAKSYQKIGALLTNTQYRLGMSGTAFRDDGNDMVINSLCGYKCYQVNANELITDGWLIKPKIKFLKVNLDKEEVKDKIQKTKSGLINESDNYMLFYEEFISKNDKRNELVKKIVDDNKGKKILILTKLINHGETLSNLTNGVHLFGETKSIERTQMMNEFKSGEKNVLVSTIGIFSEGIDLPHLDIIINASANKGDVKTIQILGRVLRKNENKDVGEYYDFIDDSRFFKNASLSRVRIFKKEEHNVEIL